MDTLYQQKARKNHSPHCEALVLTPVASVTLGFERCTGPVAVRDHIVTAAVDALDVDALDGLGVLGVGTSSTVIGCGSEQLSRN